MRKFFRVGASGRVGVREGFSRFGLVERRLSWCLSARGWLLLFLIVGALSFLSFLRVYSFFAITARENATLLVIEGWLPQYCSKVAISEFHQGGYTRIFATGGPVTGMGGYVNDYSTAANIGAANLRALGISPESVQSVPSRTAARDRTYGSAVALKTWLKTYHADARCVNVMTADVHARRTRLLFQLAMGPRIKVGVVSIPNPDYAANEWWRYSEGVRSVVGETIAYGYAKLFFYP